MGKVDEGDNGPEDSEKHGTIDGQVEYEEIDFSHGRGSNS